MPTAARTRARTRALPLACYLFAALALAACSDPATSATSTNLDAATTADSALLGDASDLPTSPTDTATADASADAIPSGPCTDGTSACHNATLAKICVNGEWLVKAKCAQGEVCNQGACAQPTSCTPGASNGCDGYTTELVCALDGKAWIPTKCPKGQQCAAGKCRAVVCTPGIAECVTAKEIRTCLDDGSGFGPPTDCKSAATCFGGKCLSLCEANVKVASNVGCDYWSADLDNYPDPFSRKKPDQIPHSIVISNPGVYDANLQFTIPAPFSVNIPNPVVKKGETVEFKMPVFTIDGNGIWNQAIYVKSDQPVVAFQFNPFDAEGAASNDGSLLLPQNALGKKYFVVSRPSGAPIPIGSLPAQHGYFTVVAPSPGDTNVSITVTSKVEAKPAIGLPALKPGQTWKVKLKQHDVLNLEALGEMSFTPNDLTGTYVDADKPIAVFAGHEELVESYEDATVDGCCAEHVEEQLMPLEAWGNEALCAKTKPRGSEYDIWYVMAGEPGVTVKTTPSIKGLDGKTFAKPGESVRVETPESFMLQATGKVQVVQFIVSGGSTDKGTGDPTMMIVPPASQYRNDYAILTAGGYGANHATVVRPVGLQIKVDGQVVPDSSFAPFGDGSWEIGYVDLKKGGHYLEATGAFGLWVYGYGNATAYGYPGGMNLK